jgi:hypothetical protein
MKRLLCIFGYHKYVKNYLFGQPPYQELYCERCKTIRKGLRDDEVSEILKMYDLMSPGSMYEK